MFIALSTVKYKALGRFCFQTKYRLCFVLDRVACLENAFKKLAAQPFNGLKFIVTASDESIVDDLVKELRKTKGVQNVIVRDKNGDKTILEVDSVQKPHILIKALRDKSGLGIFVEKISNSSVELNVS